MSLQQLIIQIQGLSGSDGDLNSLNDLLRAHGTDALLQQQAASILDTLELLSFEVHSRGCLYLL